MALFRSLLIELMNNYNQARTEPFKEHTLGNLVRKRITEQLYTQSNIDRNQYYIKGSVGQGNWAYVPWIAIMNKEVTISTQRGYYLVYLFSEDMNTVYLALAQGVTETNAEKMEQVKAKIRERLDIQDSRIHKDNHFNLGESKLAIDYQKSTAIYIPYSVDNIPADDQLMEDLKIMLGYYEDYIALNNQTNVPTMIDKYLNDVIHHELDSDQFQAVYDELKDVISTLLTQGTVTNPTLIHSSKEVVDKIPFIENVNSTYKLKQFTTLQMPDANYRNAMQHLKELLNHETSETTNKANPNISRMRQGLKLLDYLNEKDQLTITSYPEQYEQEQRIVTNPIFQMVLKVLQSINNWNKTDKTALLKEILIVSVVSSTDGTTIKNNVLDKRLSYMFRWLQHVEAIDEELCIMVSSPFSAYYKGVLKETVQENITNLYGNELIEHIYDFIQAKGFYYKKEDIKNFYLSLKTKPFVIITGISGTGKSKIVEKFAESVGATVENGRFQLIAIRPDWNDGSDLIGYVDIKGDFQTGPLTSILEAAMQDPDRPYFILLDEMNLARVEYYFSDVLSIIESRKWKGSQIKTAPILNNATKQVIIPDNVYLIGTVNMDETTHPFSPKVLDRANTIEFNDVDLLKFSKGKTNEQAYINTDNKPFQSQFVTINDAYTVYESLILRTTEKLVDINSILEKSKRHFGYRVRDDICFYMIYNEQSNLMDEDAAFDIQLLQKILPKLAGSDVMITEIIEELFTICAGQAISAFDIEDTFEQTRYPRSARKLKAMHKSQQENGFTSYWIV